MYRNVSPAGDDARKILQHERSESVIKSMNSCVQHGRSRSVVSNLNLNFCRFKSVSVTSQSIHKEFSMALIFSQSQIRLRFAKRVQNQLRGGSVECAGTTRSRSVQWIILIAVVRRILQSNQ
jgi:ribosomal protein S14